MALVDAKCVPCEVGMPPLTYGEAEKLSKEVPEWKLADDAKNISRTFKFKNFRQALVFVNKVGEVAEAEGHHPDILLKWGRVDIELSTHAIKGLSENDFILAAKIDAL